MRIHAVLGALAAAVLTATACGAAPGLDDQQAGAQPAAAHSAGHSAGRSAAAAAARRSFTVVAAGDVLLHDPVTRQARRDGHGRLDYRQVLAGVEPVLRGADLAICHMETPFGPPLHGYPVFGVPPQIAGSLAAVGFRTCSTASNHSLDEGAAGVRRTLTALDRAGIRHTGTARSAAEAARPNILNVGGVPVAQLSYAYGFNGFRLPRGKPWLANQINAPAILAAARRARRAGAQVVIVSLHWGTEYDHRATAEQVALARRLLASPDIDLIVGHHVHVVQPFTRERNGKWVAFGMGNLVAAQHGLARNEGLLARFTFTATARPGHWRVSRAEYVPTYVDQGPPLRVLDVPAALRSPGLSAARRRLLRRVERDTARVVGSRGAHPSMGG